MAAIVLDTDGFDIAHEKLMLEEYGEEVMNAGWIPPLTLKGESGIALAIAPVEASDDDELLLSAALPQCP
jgi:hypothetical protein